LQAYPKRYYGIKNHRGWIVIVEPFPILPFFDKENISRRSNNADIRSSDRAPSLRLRQSVPKFENRKSER
jgi:hypothetical protein